MKLFAFVLAGALAQDLSTVDEADSFSYYYDEYGIALGNVTDERGSKPLIRDDPGSCLTCAVEGDDYSAALVRCRKKGKFVQCNRESAIHEKNPQFNLCELTERRNNGKVQLTATCNQKQACVNNQAQNKRQCLPLSAKDRK